MGRSQSSRSVSASQPVTAKEIQEVEENEKKVKSPSPKKKTVQSSNLPDTHIDPINEDEIKVFSKEKGEDEISEKDLEKGMNLLVAMSNEDFQTLLDKIDAQSPKIDKIKAKIRNGRLDWDKIAFGMYAPRECSLIWQFLLSNARRYRIMSEVVQEFRYAVEHNPRYVSTISNIPQQPPGARGGYQVYVRELWKIHQTKCSATGQKHMNWCQFYKVSQDGYQKLTEKQKEHYEKESKKENDKYQSQLQAYLKEHPHLVKGKTTETEKVPKVRKRKPTTVKEFPDAPIPPVPPYSFFIQSKLQKLETTPSAEELSDLKGKFCSKYHKLSDKKKAKWIDYTINYSQNYTKEVEMFQSANPSYCPKVLKIKSVVKKSDIVIWEKYRDKPPNPKNSVYAMFIDDFCKNEENADIPIDERRREAENAFKELDWYQRETYKINFKLSSMKYRKEIAEYFQNVPDVVKPIVIDTIPRKYRAGLLDVGKFPIVDGMEDENADKEEFGEYTEEEPSPRKRKKKRRNDELSETDDPTSPSNKNNLDEESEEIVSDASASRRKKKKRKDGFATSQSPDDHEVITGDINVEDDDQSIKIEEPFHIEVKPQPRFSPRRDLPKLKPVTQEQPILSNTTVVPKPSASNFVPHKVGQQDIDDAIRGIFDGRAVFGRKFSVYYYYAKYVCQDKKWVAHTDLFGILETADKIVAAFIELSDKQKDIFIAQSYNFFLQKRYGITMKGTKKIYEPEDGIGINRFPGEPRLPARTAAKLYEKEVEYLIRKNVSLDFPKWEDLHVDTQMIFVKKLYRETQLYMKKYEEFVLNMSPNDMVSYVLFRAKNWENRYLKDSAALDSVKGFVFPLPRNGKDGDGYESCPDVMDDNVPGLAAGCRVYLRQKRHQKLNPFTVERPDFCSISNSKSQVQISRSAEAGEDADESTCVSSDDETMTPAKNYIKDQTNMRHLNEVKDHFFPMGVLTKKMLSPTKVKKRLSKVELERMRKAHEALAASRRMKRPKGIEARIRYKNRVKTIGFARNRKAKVMLPKQRNFNDGDGNEDAAKKKKAKVLLPQHQRCGNVALEESGSDGEIGGADFDENADEANLDCSEFVSSLQSPKKRIHLKAVPDDTTEECPVNVWGEGVNQSDGQLIEEVILEPFNAYARDIEQDTENAEDSFAGPVFDISDFNL